MRYRVAHRRAATQSGLTQVLATTKPWIRVMQTKAILIFLLACFTIFNADARDRKYQTLRPEQAIRQAKWKYPDGILANYRFVVRASGEQKGVIYLNSEFDYRDEKCLTVVIPFALAEQFREQFGDLVGKEILVTGLARRAEIIFEDSDALRYFQTHVYVRDLKQINVIAGG